MKGELAPHVQQERVGHLAEHGEGAARRELAQPFRHFVRVTAQVVAIEFLYGGGGGGLCCFLFVCFLCVVWFCSFFFVFCACRVETFTQYRDQRGKAGPIDLGQRHHWGERVVEALIGRVTAQIFE